MDPWIAAEWSRRSWADPTQRLLALSRARARQPGPLDADAVGVAVDALDAVEHATAGGHGFSRDRSIATGNRAIRLAARAAVAGDLGGVAHARGASVVAWLLADYATCAPGDPERALSDVWLHHLGLEEVGVGEDFVLLEAARGVAVLERLIEAAERPEVWQSGKALRRLLAGGLEDPAATRDSSEERADRRHHALERMNRHLLPRPGISQPDAELAERELLAALGPEAQAVLELRIEGRSERDIGDALGISRRRVRSALEEIRTIGAFPRPEV